MVDFLIAVGFGWNVLGVGGAGGSGAGGGVFIRRRRFPSSVDNPLLFTSGLSSGNAGSGGGSGVGLG